MADSTAIWVAMHGTVSLQVALPGFPWPEPDGFVTTAARTARRLYCGWLGGVALTVPGDDGQPFDLQRHLRPADADEGLEGSGVERLGEEEALAVLALISRSVSYCPGVSMPSATMSRLSS